jgi:hypothetical protein
MRDLGDAGASGSGTTTTLPSCAEVEDFAARLAGSGSGMDDAQRIDLIHALEVPKCAAEGAQAPVTADFDASQRDRAAAAGVPVERQGRGIDTQIALARRESPHRGRRQVGLARILRAEMPHTLAALRSGRIAEWRATILVRETACLSLADRVEIDLRLARAAFRLEELSERELVTRVRALACSLDPASVAERRRRAEADRHTSLRPAPDTMTWFSALLPVKDGVAIHKALMDEANRLKSRGDSRSKGAIMADTLVHRVLSPHIAAAGPAEVPLVINVVVPDTVLLGDKDGAGWVEEYGDVPATCCGSGSPLTPRRVCWTG